LCHENHRDNGDYHKKHPIDFLLVHIQSPLRCGGRLTIRVGDGH
jgi:hypothetical protein